VDLERAPVLPYAVRDHEPGIGRRLHARGAGRPVAEFMLHIHDDGTAGWRWHDEPFDAVNP
jgi:hypothetical protein